MQRSDCNMQEPYETKALAPEWPSVKDYFSDKFSNNKAPIVPRQALELAAGATARLTGLDSATTLQTSEQILWFLQTENTFKMTQDWKCRDGIKYESNLRLHGGSE